MAASVQTEVVAPASPGCLTTNLGWLLSQVEDVLDGEMAAALEPLGLSSRWYCVLASAINGEYTQIELANMIGLDKTTMVVTIDALEKSGLAKRLPSTKDRRVRVISVTAAGKRKVAKAREVVDRVQADVLSRLPAADRRALLAGLQQLVSA